MCDELPKAGQVSPAINRNRLARNPAGGWREEKCNQIRDFLGWTGTAQRVRGLGALDELRVLAGVHAAAAMEIGDHDTGIDGVDADAFGREVEGRRRA
jgi:hypothetical protein